MRLLTGTPRHRSQARPAPSPPASDHLLLTRERASADSPRPRRLRQAKSSPPTSPTLPPTATSTCGSRRVGLDGRCCKNSRRHSSAPRTCVGRSAPPLRRSLRPIPGHSGRPLCQAGRALCGWFCPDVFLGRRRGVDHGRGCIRASPTPVPLWPVTPASAQEACLLVHGSPAFPPELFQHFGGCRPCGAKPASAAALPNPLTKDHLRHRRAGHRPPSDSVPSPPLRL